MVKKVGVTFAVPPAVKKDIKKLVRAGDYRSMSEFIREAVYRRLDEITGRGDPLRQKKFQNFIDEIS